VTGVTQALEEAQMHPSIVMALSRFIQLGWTIGFKGGKGMCI
jgi:hypothetical protein